MTKAKNNNPVPVTLLSGFLGAGKTTLLMNILRNKEKLRCAVIVNDMASLNIDSMIIEKSEVLQVKEELIQMQNGCICCTLRGDLMKNIANIVSSNKFDYIVIESTGISEPQQVAETFAAPADMLLGDDGPKDLESLVGIARMDTCVTVVDAVSFFDYLENTKFLNEALTDAKEDDTERTVATLLVEQVEFANLIIINKVSLVSEKSLKKLKGFIKTINSAAEIICTDYSKVPLNKLLNTNKFDMEEAEKNSDWLKSLDEIHVPETEEYGIGSFLYKSDRPFHAMRLFEMVCKYFVLLETGYEKNEQNQDDEDENNEKTSDTVSSDEAETEEKIPEKNEDEEDEETMEKERQQRIKCKNSSAWRGLMRSKGYFWLATRPDSIGSWAVAGSLLNINYAGEVNVDDADDEGNEMESCPLVPPNGGEESEQSDNDILAGQQLVFIGSFVADEKEQMKKDLNSCLLTDEEMIAFDAGDLAQFEDPWEEWPVEGDADAENNHDHDDRDKVVDLDDDASPKKKQKK